MTPFQTPWYQLERDTADRLCRTTNAGVPFNVAGAQALYAEMEAAAADYAAEVQKLNPPRTIEETFIPKRDNKTRGYKAGEPFIKRRVEPLNINSPVQLAARASELGYVAQDFTDGGSPKMNAVVLTKIAAQFPEFLPILAAKVTEKRMTMIDGPNGWLNSVDADGRLRTNYDVTGTVTFRCSHTPNIAQVPKVHLDANDQPRQKADGHWGWECRSLFSAPEGWHLVGCDQAGLELRCLAHALWPWDGGNYATVVTSGDPHALTQQATGLASRATAKTLIYASVYGCGNKKAGVIVEPDESDEFYLNWIGKRTRNALLDGIPGFRQLFEWVQKQTPLIGLDGRPLFVRNSYSALNVLLQSTGATICKRWLLLTDDALQAQGLKPNEVDYELLIFCHDELQYCARTLEIAEIIKATCIEQAQRAGEFYGLHCPTSGEGKIGFTWADTH